jgi:alpha-N-acetylglucosamine transferase
VREIERAGIETVKVDELRHKRLTTTGTIETRFEEVYSKLHGYGLTQFNRIAMLDADMLVLQNMDELMDIEIPFGQIAASHACVCNPRRLSYYPSYWQPESCAYTHQDRETAHIEGIPSTFGLQEINGGLVIYEPSAQMHARFLRAFETLETPELPFADQSLQSKVLQGNWVALPYVYNALKTLRTCHANIWQDDKVKNVHYILNKPWNENPRDSNADPTHKWWWDVENERTQNPLIK